MFAPMKGGDHQRMSDHHGPTKGRTLKADVPERQDTGEAWQSVLFWTRMSDSAVTPASPWPCYH